MPGHWLMTAAGCLLAVTGSTRAETPEEALKSLQGAYTVTSLEFNGRAAPGAVGLKVTIDGDTLTLNDGGRTETMKLKPDPAAAPKKLDMLRDGRTTQAIYKLEGEVLTICFNKEDGSKRPTEFSSRGGPISLFVLKRDKK